MGSIMSEIECPNCGLDAVEDYYYKTGEQYVICQKCGYNYRAEIKDWKDGEPVWVETEIKEPACSWREEFEKGAIVGGMSKEEYQATMDQIQEYLEEAEARGVKKIVVSKVVLGKLVEEIIYENEKSKPNNSHI